MGTTCYFLTHLKLWETQMFEHTATALSLFTWFMQSSLWHKVVIPTSLTSLYSPRASLYEISQPASLHREHGAPLISFSPGYCNSGSGLKQLLKAISFFLFQNSSERMHFHYSPSCPELLIVVLAEANRHCNVFWGTASICCSYLVIHWHRGR